MDLEHLSPGHEYFRDLLYSRETLWEVLGVIYADNLHHRHDDEMKEQIGRAIDEYMSGIQVSLIIPPLVDSHVRFVAQWLFNQGNGPQEVAEEIRMELDRFCLLQRVRRIDPTYLEQILHDAHVESALEHPDAES
jgi:hypothetical protein